MTAKGTYLLVMYMAVPHTQLAIGRLGRCDFAAGYYLYVGSAFGAGGLSARLAHHRQTPRPRPHWHIDYLRPAIEVQQVWTVACARRLEHAWCAALLEEPGLQVPLRGFGASDSRCPAHLFFAPACPPPHLLSGALFRAVAGDTGDTTDMTSLTIEITSVCWPGATPRNLPPPPPSPTPLAQTAARRSAPCR